MRLLIISPLFAPMAIAEAICGGLFVKALRQAGVDVRVVMSSDALPDIDTDRSKCWLDLEDVVYDVRSPASLPLQRRVRFGAKYQIVTWTGWTNTVVDLAERLHRRSPFTAVMSRSIPTQAHYAGFWIARRLKLPWLVNINDPMDFGPFVTDARFKRDWSVGTAERLWHRRILKNADIVTFPCERLRTHVLDNTRRSKPSADLPHVGICSERPALRDRFLVVHVGRLSDNTSRSAETILDGVSTMLERFPERKALITLRFVGPPDSALLQAVMSRGLGEVVEFAGSVNFEDSLEHISESTVCLLVEGALQQGVFLPSKLCHYLAARKPIIALSPAAGTVSDLARQGEVARVTRGDAGAAYDAFNKLFEAFVAGQLESFRPSHKLANTFRPEAVARRFIELARSIDPIRGPVHGDSARILEQEESN